MEPQDIFDLIEVEVEHAQAVLELPLHRIETAVADYLASKYPIYQFEDPYPILPQNGLLIPVKIPLRNLTATVNTNEMIVLADVG